MKKIDTLVIDKTGTLTVGKPEVRDIKAFGGFSEQDVLQSVASVESHSEHPIAGAILRAAQLRGLNLLPISNFESRTGTGVSAMLETQHGHVRALVGNVEQMQRAGIDIAVAESAAQQFREQAKTVLFAAMNGQLSALIAVADPVRDSSAQVLKKLGDQQIHVVMASGDNRATANAIARQVGIEEVRAEEIGRASCREREWSWGDGG